jgi:hypothetical protein
MGALLVIVNSSTRINFLASRHSRTAKQYQHRSKMAPATFSLIELKSNVSEQSFISAVQKLGANDRPVYVGKCQHWIHAPQLSRKALAGNGNTMKKWDYLIVNKAAGPQSFTIPKGLASSIESSWSLTTEVPDEQLDNHKSAEQTRLAAPVPELPQGWSPSDHSGLDASEPPPDLEASLALSAYPLGSCKDSGAKPIGLKEFTRTFGTKHTGPINMFNLLSFMPDQMSRYMQYVAAFQASVGIKYGGQPSFVPSEAPDWSSRSEEERQVGGWDTAALIWYPSIWHFSKMLDDPGYADADRKYKQGALRDNPIICCTEVDID